MYRIKKTTWAAAAIFAMCVCGTSALAQEISELIPSSVPVGADTTLTADVVWRSNVGELEWSRVQPALTTVAEKTWLTDDYDFDSTDHVVVKGVAGSQPAMRRAVNEHILPLIENHVEIKSVWDRQLARRRIQRELARVDDIVLDNFSQTFYRQAGDEEIEVFTREALLLDLSLSIMAPIAHDIQRDLHRVHRVRSDAFGFGGIAMIAVFVVCWIASRFLNRVTRGYYVWPIRVVTGLVVLSSLGLTAGIAVSILRRAI